MIVDYLRSCYSCEMRFVTGDPSRLSPVSWYFADDDADILPYYNRFSSRNYDRDAVATADSSLGETTVPPHPWRNGSPLETYEGIGTCTSAALWSGGMPTVPATPFDKDACCAYPECVILDLFKGANGSVVVGRSPTRGPAWFQGPFTFDFTIQSNEARDLNTGASQIANTLINTGLSDCTITAKVNTGNRMTDGGQSIYFRHSNNNNFWWVAALNATGNPDATAIFLLRRVAGVTSLVQTAAWPAVDNTLIEMKLELNGPQIRFYINSTLRLSRTDSFNQTATNHGISSGAGQAGTRNKKFTFFCVE